MHATDEIVTEYAVETYAANAPLHVVAIRTPEAKYATYSNWPQDGIAPSEQGRETELYDYRTQSGRLEIENSAGTQRPRRSHAEPSTSTPSGTSSASPSRGACSRPTAAGFADYFLTSQRAATVAVERRHAGPKTACSGSPASTTRR